MARSPISVEELLLRHRAIDEDQLRAAREQQKKVGSSDLGRVLVELGYVSEELLLRAQAHQLGIPMVNLEQSPPPRALAAALTEALCKRFGVIPVSGNLDTKLLRVATSNPTNSGRLTMLSEASGFRIEAAAATAASIDKAIRAAFSGAPERAAPAADPAHPELHPEPDELADLRGRVQRMEAMLSNPQFAALLARVERLEQIAESDHRALNVLGQVLLEHKLISRDELKKRLGRG